MVRRTNLARMEQTNSTLIQRLDGSAVTEDGLVLKNVARIERFNLQVDSRVEANMLSWQMCRTLRRDFNYIASKMLVRRKDRHGAQQIRSLVMDVRMLAEELASEAASFPPNPAPEHRVVPIRIVSAEAANVFLAILQADEAYGRLNYALHNNHISERDLNHYAANFEIGLSGLKLFLNNAAGAKTTRELAVEQGIA